MHWEETEILVGFEKENCLITYISKRTINNALGNI